MSKMKPRWRPTPGSLYTDPAASIVTGRCDGKLPEMDSLPFIKKNPPKIGGYCYWAVKPSNNYTIDCETGRAYAHMLLPFLKYNGGIPLLGFIVLDMIQSGTKNGEGLVVGFMAELSRELSSTRASLVLFATAAARAPASLSPRLKNGHALLKRMAVKAAIPTVKRLANVI
jgi:hypothetical protein